MKKVVILVAASVCVALFCTGPANAMDKAKKEKIVQLMEMTGAKNIAVQFAQAMNQQVAAVLKASNPDMPERAFVILDEELGRLMKEEADGLIEQIIPVYDKHFTENEIKEVIKFYQTPVGKKTIQVMPQLLQESMAIGQTWGEQVAPKLFERLEQRFKKENIPIPE